MSKIQDYAAAVDAETNRLAVLVEDLLDGQDAQLQAAFEPVLVKLRGVGVAGPTAPPEPTPGEDSGIV